MQTFDVKIDQITISTNPSKLDVGVVHDYLSNHTHWAKNRSYETVEESIKNSLCFGVYSQNRLIGFSRVITDYEVFAFLLDVFVVDEFQGKGIGKLLIKTTLDHPDLQKNMVWTLATKDAHGLYRQYGFTELADSSLWMQFDKRHQS